jgi:hypothetical protein
MTGPVKDTSAMVAGMNPHLADGLYVFVTTQNSKQAKAALDHAVGFFVEDEGRSFILDIESARALGFAIEMPMRRITLTVWSALDGVGLTAAAASALAAVNIPCNMVAAYHHDHIFVPAHRAEDAVEALLASASQARSS